MSNRWCAGTLCLGALAGALLGLVYGVVRHTAELIDGAEEPLS